MHLISHNILRSGIPIVQVVAGPRVSSSTDDGYALALTDNGDVYSWGKGYKGEIDYTRDCALAYVILVTLLHDLVLGMATVHIYIKKERIIQNQCNIIIFCSRSTWSFYF